MIKKLIILCKSPGLSSIYIIRHQSKKSVFIQIFIISSFAMYFINFLIKKLSQLIYFLSFESLAFYRKLNLFPSFFVNMLCKELCQLIFNSKSYKLKTE